jgi:hypothetical protein
MRRLCALALAALAAGCGFKPGTPDMMGANEMRPRPGVFSGPTGEFLIVGTRPDPALNQPAGNPPAESAPKP